MAAQFPYVVTYKKYDEEAIQKKIAVIDQKLAKATETKEIKKLNNKKEALEAIKFVEEDGIKYELDSKGKKIDITFKSIEAVDVIKFLKENGSKKDIETFKTNIKTKKTYEKDADGKDIKSKPTGTVIVEDDPKFSNWLYAKQEFCKVFCPELIAEKKEKKPTILDLLKDL